MSQILVGSLLLSMVFLFLLTIKDPSNVHILIQTATVFAFFVGGLLTVYGATKEVMMWILHCC